MNGCDTDVNQTQRISVLTESQSHGKLWVAKLLRTYKVWWLQNWCSALRISV